MRHQGGADAADGAKGRCAAHDFGGDEGLKLINQTAIVERTEQRAAPFHQQVVEAATGEQGEQGVEINPPGGVGGQQFDLEATGFGFGDPVGRRRGGRPFAHRVRSPLAYENRTEDKSMLNLLVWLIVGAVIGWAAGLVLGDRNSVVVNIIVGVVGAMIGGFLFGGPTINQNALSLNAMLISLVGAIIFLGIVQLVRRGRWT